MCTENPLIGTFAINDYPDEISSGFALFGKINITFTYRQMFNLTKSDTHSVNCHWT